MREIHLTKKEAQILDLLEQNAGEPVSKKLLLEHVWGYREGVRTRTLDVHISRLRNKGSWPKSATEVEGFWIQQVGGAAAGVNPRSI